MTALSQSGLVEALGWMLIHSLWQGALAAAILAIFLLPLRGRQSAALSSLRYIFACATLLAVVGASIATFAISYPGAPTKLPMDTSFQPAIEITPMLTASTTGTVSSAPFDWRGLMPLVVALWAAGLSVQFAWQSASLVSIHRKSRGEGITDKLWLDSLKRIVARLGIHRAVRLVASTRLEVPAVIGIFRPVIVIPIAMLNDLPIDHAEAILAHELAHIRRCDYALNLIQIGIETIFFYHPAVWWISSQIRRERENCCDDIAASVCGRVICASALVALESRRGPRAVPAASGSSLLRRVRRLLNEPQARGGWTISALIAIVAMLCIFTPLYWPKVSLAQSNPSATTQPAISTPPQDQNDSGVDFKSADDQEDDAVRSLKLNLLALTDRKSSMELELNKMLAEGYADQNPTVAQLKRNIDLMKAKIDDSQRQVDQFNKQKQLQQIFLDVTVSLNGSLTCDGAPSSWHDIDRHLQDMPESQRRATILALSAASPDVPVGIYIIAQYQSQRLVQDHHLAYLRMTGINPPHKPFPAALPEDLSHVVPFKIGKTYFDSGDSVTIQEIRGSSDHLVAGNTYEIKGSYHLASHEQASLQVHITSWAQNPPGQSDCVPLKIQKGDGQFTMKLHMWVDGSPHVSIYAPSSDGGDSTVSVYFGTEPGQLN